MPSPSVVLRRALIFRRTIICSLLAGFALYGLAHAPQADAQYPGGPSWQALPRPGVGNPKPYTGDYDWTGLIQANSYTYYGMSGGSGPVPVYGGYVFYPPTVDNAVTLWSASAAGTSTYKWQWVPPNNAASTPDYANFPAPPLYVLTDLGFKTAVTLAGSSANGLTASGAVSSGFDSWNPSFNTVPGQAPSDPSEVPHRGILPAAADGGMPSPLPYTYDVAFSPSARVIATCTTDPNAGACQPYFAGTETLFPLVLSQPNPLSNPLLGDGSNQFVYSADMPDGYLYVPGAVRAVGGSHDDSEWLINNNPIFDPSDKIDLRIEGNGTTSTPIPNTFAHQWAVSNDTIFVNTPQDPNNPYPGYQFNH